MFAALVVCRRAPQSGRGLFRTDPFQIPIEGEVEVEPGLFTVGDDIGPRLELVVDGRNDRVVYHFGDVVAAEPVQVGAGELKPGGEGIAADDGSAKRDGLH